MLKKGFNGLFFVIMLIILGCSILKEERDQITYNPILNEERYEIERGDYQGEREFVQKKYEDGVIESEGKVALSKEGNRSELKIGKWISYYKSGKIRIKGNYEIGNYVQCCYSGPCMQFYNYKTGEWKYYYENGKLEAEGRYIEKSLKLRTSCRGGANVRYGILDDSWTFYDEHENEISISDSMKLRFEEVENFYGYYVPDIKKRELQQIISYKGN